MTIRSRLGVSHLGAGRPERAAAPARAGQTPAIRSAGGASPVFAGAVFGLKLLLTVLLWASGGAAAAQHIEMRISIKIIVSPAMGLMPAGLSNGLFEAAVDRANEWMAGYGRGYRFRITELASIGGPAQGGTAGPSKWFGVTIRGTNAAGQPLEDLLHEDARTNSLYLRRADQLNFYVNGSPVGNTGGWCPIPPNETQKISCWGLVNDGPFWLVHETGHFFGLSHTFGGCQCSGGCTYPSRGDDGVPDTLPEGDCWNTNQLATGNFAGTNYVQLTAAARQRVDDTYFNAMSYHNVPRKDLEENRLTELQLDLHAETANTTRNAFVSGRTRFVSLAGHDSSTGLRGVAPKRTVLSAAAASAGGDIVLLRPGHYNEQITLANPVTLRTTRAGPATIGRP